MLLRPRDKKNDIDLKKKTLLPHSFHWTIKIYKYWFTLKNLNFRRTFLGLLQHTNVCNRAEGVDLLRLLLLDEKKNICTTTSLQYIFVVTPKSQRTEGRSTPTLL